MRFLSHSIPNLWVCVSFVMICGACANALKTSDNPTSAEFEKLTKTDQAILFAALPIVLKDQSPRSQLSEKHKLVICMRDNPTSSHSGLLNVGGGPIENRTTNPLILAASKRARKTILIPDSVTSGNMLIAGLSQVVAEEHWGSDFPETWAYVSAWAPAYNASQNYAIVYAWAGSGGDYYEGRGYYIYLRKNGESWIVDHWDEAWIT